MNLFLIIIINFANAEFPPLSTSLLSSGGSRIWKRGGNSLVPSPSFRSQGDVWHVGDEARGDNMYKIVYIGGC